MTRSVMVVLVLLFIGMQRHIRLQVTSDSTKLSPILATLDERMRDIKQQSKPMLDGVFDICTRAHRHIRRLRRLT